MEIIKNYNNEKFNLDKQAITKIKKYFLWENVIDKNLFKDKIESIK